MKKCPFCAELIQDEAVKCRFCGEFLDQAGPRPALAAGASAHDASEPIPRDRMAEIRRLQRIAAGRPTRGDSARKAKGLLSLVIIVAIIAYAWHWRRVHDARQAVQAEATPLSFQEFSVLFGPDSPLSPDAKDELFGKHKGRTVAWTGEVVYINRAANGEAYASVRQRATTRTADVTVYFNRRSRGQLDGLHVGDRVKYAGRLHDYGRDAGFVTLKDGAIMGRE